MKNERLAARNRYPGVISMAVERTRACFLLNCQYALHAFVPVTFSKGQFD